MNDDMYPLNNMPDISSDFIPDTAPYAPGYEDAGQQFQLDAGNSLPLQLSPDMEAFAAGVGSPDFVPDSSPAPGVMAEYVPAAEASETCDAIAPDILTSAKEDFPISGTVSYEDLPKFPGALDHGMDFDGPTWETLGGSESYVAADLSGDGSPDVFGIDFDGDGITDVAGRYLDTDGDGVFDAIGIDRDQDGSFDSIEDVM